MKFTFTVEATEEALIASFKESTVFRGDYSKINNIDYILSKYHFIPGGWYCLFRNQSFVKLYYHSVSQRTNTSFFSPKQIRNQPIRTSVSYREGFFVSTYTLKQQKIETLIQETLPYLTSSYMSIRLHDLTVLLLMKYAYQAGSEQHTLASQHLAALVVKNKKILNHYDKLQHFEIFYESS